MKPIRFTLATLLLAAACICTSGCNRSGTTISYTLGRKNNAAVLTVGKLTLVFDGVPFTGPDAGDLAKGFVQVSGPGHASGNAGVNEVKITSNYANGTQRMSVGGYPFDILNKGQTLKIGDQTVDVTKSRTIEVKKDGTTSTIP